MMGALDGDDRLIALRATLPEEDALMRRGIFTEYCDAESGEGRGLDPFWGWSLLGHFLTYEERTEADITAIE